MRMYRAEQQQKLIEEVKEGFILSVKKAIVDFVLQDPSECDNRIRQYDSAERQELLEMSKTWKNSFQHALVKIQKSLHVVNPCLAQVLDLWYKSFRYGLFLMSSNFGQNKNKNVYASLGYLRIGF